MQMGTRDFSGVMGMSSNHGGIGCTVLWYINCINIGGKTKLLMIQMCLPYLYLKPLVPHKVLRFIKTDQNILN